MPYNSTLRPLSPKRAAALRSGALKPKPRKPLRSKAKNEDGPSHKHQFLTRKKPTATLGGKPDPKVIAALKKVVEKYQAPLPQKSQTARARLHDELVSLFSEYVRRKEADDMGVVTCFLCGKELPWEYSVLMHFQPRKELGLAFNETANHAGCAGCNGKPNGDWPNCARKLDKVYGHGTAEDLTIKSKEVMHYDRQWYRERIEHYKSLLSKMR